MKWVRKVVECFGAEYTAHYACGRCTRFVQCGEEWAERNRHRVMHAHYYGTGVGNPSPWGENTVREMEEGNKQ